VDSIALGRRAFLRKTGLAAVAVAADGIIGLGSDSARASSADKGTLPDYARYDAVGLAALVKARQISAEALLEAAIEGVEQHNGAVNAVVYRLYDQAKAAVAAGLPSGPFTGVPFLLKDLASYTLALSRLPAPTPSAISLPTTTPS
jgi:hypothetical protein